MTAKTGNTELDHATAGLTDSSAWEVRALGKRGTFEVRVRSAKEASQTREYSVAKNATLRAARPGPSPGKKRPSQDDSEFYGG